MQHEPAPGAPIPDRDASLGYVRVKSHDFQSGAFALTRPLRDLGARMKQFRRLGETRWLNTVMPSAQRRA